MAELTDPADGRPEILFERLLRPHFDALYGRAYRLTGSAADAEDLVQDLCVRVYPRIAELADLDNPRAWLMRVLHRLFIDLARRRQRSPLESIDGGDADAPLEAVSAEPGPERQVDGMLAYAQLQRAWRHLAHEQRVLLVLQGIDGHSLAEIESITGITQGTLKSKLHRARARLGRLLAREERPSIAELRGTDHELRRHRKFAG